MSYDILVLGSTGLVGSAVLRKLNEMGYKSVLGVNSSRYDLRKQVHVVDLFTYANPKYVFNCAGRVGGIVANSTYPADFIYDNIMIASNVINCCYRYNSRLVNLGSSCIYPKFAPQPLKEEYLLTGSLEPTNEPYAIAKIAAIKMCSAYNRQYGTNFISVMPCNLYGINDNFDLTQSHLLPALIRKFHEANLKSTDVTLWGDGSPYREFLFADDLADALTLMMSLDASDIGEFINIGTGESHQIKELAYIVAELMRFKGNIFWDTSMPNGTPFKEVDNSKIFRLGWYPKTRLFEGLNKTIQWFLATYPNIRGIN